MDDEDVFVWLRDIDTIDKTNTDLEASRVSSRPYIDHRRRHEALVAHVPIETTTASGAPITVPDSSRLIDVAARVALAHYIDTIQTTFDRAEYDIAATLPPEGWVAANCPLTLASTVTVPPLADVRDDERTRTEGAVPRVVTDMMDHALRDGVVDEKTTVVRDGLELLFDIALPMGPSQRHDD